ncbi:MAG: hypothetical protein ACYC5M_14390 [Anaerolineae bacterium]
METRKTYEGEGSVAEQAARNTERLADLWWSTPTTLPDLGGTHSDADRRAREAEMGELLAYLLAQAEHLPVDPEERSAWERSFQQRVAQFVVVVLGLGEPHLNMLLNGGLDVVAREFPRRARAFDPVVSGADIFQAARNAAVINSLQVILDQEVRLTPALFAYSMLYPYTDNYLDDPRVPSEAKRMYDERFGLRLEGEGVAPRNAHERRLFDLVGLIEQQYSRENYPRVYAALQTIHCAQSRSLGLNRGIHAPLERDVLGISLAKGGASVLADAYLVRGDLDDSVASLAFGWGALLQFADDLQDVASDTADGVLTVFSQSAGHWPLDGLVNRVLRFSQQVLVSAECLTPPRLQPLRDLMAGSATALVLDAVGRHPRFFSPTYYHTLEAHTALRFSALRRGRRWLGRHQAALLGLVAKYSAVPS